MPNSIDLPACTNLWTQQQIDLYNKLPFYLAKQQCCFFKKWQVYPDLLNSTPWTPNQSDVMKGVHKEPAPVIRSTFFPNAIDTLSAKDVIEVREVTEQAKLRKHRFESNLMTFVPSFQDFLRDHVSATNEDIVSKIAIARDLFIRTYLFHASPKVWICGASPELTATAYITGSGMNAAKTTAALQALVATAGIGPLTLRSLNRLGTVMSVDEAVDFYEGSAGQQVNEGLKGKYCAVVSSEVWDAWQADAFLLANRQLDMNIVTDKFRGSLWGRWTTKLERFELRIAADGTIPAPETVEENPAAYNYGETVVNPAYVNAPFAVAFAFGADGYKTISVGPPPAPFSSGKMSEDAFSAMNWNGKVEMTRNLKIKCLDGAGAVVEDTNKYGEYIQLISQVVFGIIATRRRNVIPIIYQRARMAAQ